MMKPICKVGPIQMILKSFKNYVQKRITEKHPHYAFLKRFEKSNKKRGEKHVK